MSVHNGTLGLASKSSHLDRYVLAAAYAVVCIKCAWKASWQCPYRLQMPHASMPMLLSTIFTVLGSAVACIIIYFTAESVIRQWKLAKIPRVPGGIPLLRQLPAMAVHPLPWDYMAAWIDNTKHNIMFWGLPFQDFVIVRGGEAFKQVLQTRFKDWHKEISLSFHPFLCILGSGLVTSEGSLWQKQRKSMTPAFKGNILQDVIGIGQRAVQRLMTKMNEVAGTEQSIEIEEEFRLLTLQVLPLGHAHWFDHPACHLPVLCIHLRAPGTRIRHGTQVITEAIMSLPYQESDRVFPKLYLPIMEECHLRVLQRWREYLPIMPAWWGHRSRNRQLDAFVIDLLRARWQHIEDRCASGRGTHRCRWYSYLTSERSLPRPHVSNLVQQQLRTPGYTFPAMFHTLHAWVGAQSACRHGSSSVACRGMTCNGPVRSMRTWGRSTAWAPPGSTLVRLLPIDACWIWRQNSEADARVLCFRRNASTCGT